MIARTNANVTIMWITAFAIALSLPLSNPRFISAPSQTGAAGFIEPALLEVASVPQGAAHANISVIVGAGSTAQAAHAVTQVGGRISSNLEVIDAVAAFVPSSTIQQLARQTGVRSVIRNRQVRGSVAPQQISISGAIGGGGTALNIGAGSLNVAVALGPSTNLAWPVPVDIGADSLHRSGITGKNVTVAVMDSGVYFSPELLLNQRHQDLLNFIGQVDFTNGGRCAMKGLLPNGLQFPRFCAQTYLQSADAFGHGSHVAGTVGNRYRDSATNNYLGIAPDAGILSVRVLGKDGSGSYEDVILGIQYVILNKPLLNIRVMNLSLSAPATVPYFVDPLNRAVERAWQAGIVVVAAAGNEGGRAQTITVPGNDPYIITVGALNSLRTAGAWGDDRLPNFSSTGPTLDGFMKPDVLAPGTNIVSFMYNNPRNPDNTAALARSHPDYSVDANLFRMSGTSMATAVASGAIALMLQDKPFLTPDQVKFRLKYSAKTSINAQPAPAYGVLQQGVGRIWVLDAVRGNFPPNDRDNVGMDLNADLAHGYAAADLPFHYQGPVQAMKSDDGRAHLYYLLDNNKKMLALGATDVAGLWLDRSTMDGLSLTWNQGGWSWPTGAATNASGYAWAGGGYAWSGGGYAWSGGGYAWGGGGYAWSGGGYAWSGNGPSTSSVGATRWVEDN